MIQKINLYLSRAEQLGITPNFFMSLPYLLISEVIPKVKNGWIWLEDGGQFVCPPLPLSTPTGELPEMKIWAGFPEGSRELEYTKGYDKELLDVQYIYDPVNFLKMEGGQWEVFRKNSRKFPKRYSGKFYYTELSPSQAFAFGANQLIAGWMEDRMDSLEDAEFLANFGYFSKIGGIHRKYLIFDDEVVGLNAWDVNYKYINYRVCIVKKDLPFLSEFMRYLFYKHMNIFNPGKVLLVNDGGNLGSPDLAKFKEKLNPIEINKVYTLIPK